MQRHRVTALCVAGDLMESDGVQLSLGEGGVAPWTRRRRDTQKDKTSMCTYTSTFRTLPLLSESSHEKMYRSGNNLSCWLSFKSEGYKKIEKRNQVTIAAALELSECIYTLYSLG